ELGTQGFPVALWPLSRERCEMVRSESDGKRYLKVTNNSGPDVYIPYERVYHIHGPGLDGLCGMDVVALASRTIAHGLATERFGQKFFDNGTQMGGVVQHD